MTLLDIPWPGFGYFDLATAKKVPDLDFAVLCKVHLAPLVLGSQESSGFRPLF